MPKNKPSSSTTHVACNSKVHSVVRSSIHTGPGNWVEIGRAVVYSVRAAHAFSAVIKCRHCTLLFSSTLQTNQFLVQVAYSICSSLNSLLLFFQNSTCKYVDMGAGYIGAGQNRLLRLVKEYNLELFETNYEGKEIIFNQVSTISYTPFESVDRPAIHPKVTYPTRRSRVAYRWLGTKAGPTTLSKRV